MCLRIKKSRIRFSFKKMGLYYKPSVLREDLTVWKMLLETANPSIKATPYFYTNVKFGKGNECIMPKFTKEEFTSRHRDKHENGYHAFTDSKYALKVAEFTTFQRKKMLAVVGVYKATIPKGSLVYYGSDNDIVSSELIIYNKTV